ncbi:MAG: hypothetical protein M1541_18055 [Acidobacteria bacterium]|nr:hypothetical protein [Acidobacteriota bacterium]
MKRFAIALAIFTLTLVSAVAAEKTVKMKDLPPAVQKAVQEQAKGSELKGLAKEVENGKTYYEAETRINGHGRDILMDQTGAVVEVEEEVTMASLPPAARTAIETRATGGKITKVESVTKGNVVTYEAAIAKGGKKSEVVVGPDGSVKK